MTHQIRWTKEILETFLEESLINKRVEQEDEKAIILESIIRTRVGGWSIDKQAIEFNCSKETINRYIRELKDLYDETQKHSFILPLRKNFTKWEVAKKIKEGETNV